MGLIFGVLLNLIRLRFADPVVVGTFGLLVPFGAYGIAEHLQGSGVLAVVAMGLYVGYQAPRTSYATRQQERPVWLSIDLLLESFVFALIGLQLPGVVTELAAESEFVVVQTILLSVAVLVVVLLVRPVFVFASYSWGQWTQNRRVARWRERMSALPDDEARRRKRRGAPVPTEAQIRMRMEPVLSRPDRVIVSWAGMRGVVTLATAAAVEDVATGFPLAAAHAIVFVAFVVTVGTLLLQGLTLPVLIRRLGVADADEKLEDARELEAVRARTSEEGRAYLDGKARRVGGALRHRVLRALRPDGALAHALRDRCAEGAGCGGGRAGRRGPRRTDLRGFRGAVARLAGGAPSGRHRGARCRQPQRGGDARADRGDGCRGARARHPRGSAGPGGALTEVASRLRAPASSCVH